MNKTSNDHPASSIIYHKTAKGTEEIQTRKYALPQKLRAVLIVVDGIKNSQSILNQFGPVNELLDTLEKQGFIEQKAAVTGIAALSAEELEKRVIMAKNFMTNTIMDSLGQTTAAISFSEAVKNCTRMEELQEKFETYMTLITNNSSKKAAEDYKEEMTKLLFPK